MVAAERAAREARSYGVLFRRCWKLVGVSLVLSMHRDIDWQLVPPYFYSRVACCGVGGGPMLDDVVSYAGRAVELRITPASCQCDLEEPFGAGVAVNGSIAACAVPQLPRDSAMWSHSSSCSNFQYVQMETQTLQTAWTAQQR